jgi:hypothetical protein
LATGGRAAIDEKRHTSTERLRVYASNYGDPRAAALIWLKSRSSQGANGTIQLAINVYFEDELGRRTAVDTLALACGKRIKANIAEFPELATGAALVV